MKRINEQTNKIFNQMYINSNQSEFLDLRQVENKSDIKAQQYENKGETSKIIQPDYYRFKLVIWFKNRDKNLWIPSIDFYKGANGNYIDERTGLMKLKRRIKYDYKGKYTTAIIYMSVSKEPTTKSKSHNYPVDIWTHDQQRTYLKGGKKLVKFGFKTKGQNFYVNLESENLEDELFRFTRSRENFKKKR